MHHHSHHNQKHTSLNSEAGGFILLYVVIAITLFVGLSASIVSSTVNQVEMGAQELAAVRANMAADMALECINYYANVPGRVFDTNNITTPAGGITCGPVAGFTPMRFPGTTCVAATSSDVFGEPYQVALPNGGACADVTITTWPRQIVIAGGPTYNYCAIRVRVDGHDGDCGSSDAVRTRWEDIGGFGVPSPTNKAANTVPPNENYRDLTGPTGYQVVLYASSTALLQAQHSATAGVRTQTNSVVLSLKGPPPPAGPFGPVIGVSVRESIELLTALTSAGEDLDIQLTDMNGVRINDTRSSGAGLRYNESFQLTIGVPGGMPLPASSQSVVYLIRVTAHYPNASSSVILPLEILRNARGQL
jgi:hypothetical protein